MYNGFIYIYIISTGAYSAVTIIIDSVTVVHLHNTVYASTDNANDYSSVSCEM